MQLSKLTSSSLLVLMAFIGVLFLNGCGTIRTSPVAASSTVRLSPHPKKIYVAPFNHEFAQVLSGRQDYEDTAFRQDLQIKFQKMLVERLTKLAPAEARWVDELPNEGWLVAGEFKKIYQGSRFLRGAVGMGAGETTFETQVYVYDLSQSKDKFILTFTTGIKDPKTGQGAGSGPTPAGASALLIGVVPSTVQNVGEGLSLDASRTARAIRDVLDKYR